MLALAGEAAAREELRSIAIREKANFIAVDKDLNQGEFDGASVLTWVEGEIVFGEKVMPHSAVGLKLCCEALDFCTGWNLSHLAGIIRVSQTAVSSSALQI